MSDVIIVDIVSGRDLVLEDTPVTDVPLFPENEVVILDDYVSPGFVGGMLAGLSNALSLTDDRFLSKAPPLIDRILFARRGLKSFLAHPNFVNSLAKLQTVLREISKGNFTGAHTALNELKGLGGVSNAPNFGIALHSATEKFTVVVIHPPDDINLKPTREEIVVFLPGYAGPRPIDALDMRLIAWTDFLTNGPERRFRTDLLDAEINFGLRKFDEAIRLYDGLLTDNVLLAVAPPGSPRHKFLAIRSAFARLAQGDQLFRAQRVLSDQERQIVINLYDAAVRLLEEKGVSPDNPLRQQIEAHVVRQKTKLQSSLNFLGLWDAFVPTQKFTLLRDAAAVQISDAQESIAKFLDFLRNAEQEFEKQMDVQFQREQEEAGLAVFSTQRDKALLGVEKVTRQLEAIEDQRETLAEQTAVNHFSEILEGAAKAGPEGAVLGFIGNVINFTGQDEQLVHQKRLIDIDKAIAENEVEIIRLERKIAESRIAFYQEKSLFLANKRLNADLLYQLADLNEKRAEQRLEVAIFLAYLYERAVAFFLGKPDIRHIKFDYLDRLRDSSVGPTGAIITSADELKDDFNLVQNEFTALDQERIIFFNERVSLRESYPIQFNLFLQTGEIEFVYSLYQLSKTGPATHQCRLREVGVEVFGTLPLTGFRGTLTHHGPFLVRDKTATLDPNVTRLVPTEEQLAQALEEQRRSGSPVAAVGGILFYNLEPVSNELSLATQFVSPAPTNDQFTLGAFEGHGPTGLWKLELRDHGKLAITDILLHFAIVSRASDPFDLEPKVEDLIRKYEAELAEGDLLDKISAFSLRQNFPDTFFALETGTAELILAEDNFEDGLTNLQFKMVIAQALDQNGKGISGITLEISRPDAAFNQTRETGAGGFSEDLDAPPQPLPRDQRFPLLGAWQIRLTDPAQFNQLGDLRLFFMYAFEEL